MPSAPSRTTFAGHARRLFYQPNLPLAVGEAKNNRHDPGAGMQQALACARALDVPFAFSSNGDQFVLNDLTGQSTPVEVVLPMIDFPTPAAQWERYRAYKGLEGEAATLAGAPYYDDGGGKEPRYYQRVGPASDGGVCPRSTSARVTASKARAI